MMAYCSEGTTRNKAEDDRRILEFGFRVTWDILHYINRIDRSSSLSYHSLKYNNMLLNQVQNLIPKIKLKI
jgi:hypothetical protein